MLAGDRQTDRLQWTAAEFQTLPLPADGTVLHGHHGGSEGTMLPQRFMLLWGAWDTLLPPVLFIWQ